MFAHSPHPFTRISSLDDVKTYSDGTALISLTYIDPLKEGILAIRLIHPNGTVTAFDLPLRPVTMYPLGSSCLFVIHKTTNETTYGTVVDWNGKIISRYYDQFKCKHSVSLNCILFL